MKILLDNLFKPWYNTSRKKGQTVPEISEFINQTELEQSFPQQGKPDQFLTDFGKLILEEVEDILTDLFELNYSSPVIAGGFVRDQFLRRYPNDMDVFINTFYWPKADELGCTAEDLQSLVATTIHDRLKEANLLALDDIQDLTFGSAYNEAFDNPQQFGVYELQTAALPVQLIFRHEEKEATPKGLLSSFNYSLACGYFDGTEYKYGKPFVESFQTNRITLYDSNYKTHEKTRSLIQWLNSKSKKGQKWIIQEEKTQQGNRAQRRAAEAQMRSSRTLEPVGGNVLVADIENRQLLEARELFEQVLVHDPAVNQIRWAEINR